MSRGFSLIELIVVIAILVVTVAVSMPIYNAFQFDSLLRTAQQDVRSDMRTAQSWARAGRGDAAAGVRIASSSYTLFVGSTYDTREQAYDEEKSYPSDVQAVSVVDIIFSEYSGRPNTSTTVLLEDSRNGATATIDISSYGLIE